MHHPLWVYISTLYPRYSPSTLSIAKSKVIFQCYVSPTLPTNGVSLADCWLSDAEVPYIAAYITRLENGIAVGPVDLRSNRITDHGVKALASLLKPLSVSKLLLQDNYISADGIRQLAAAIEGLGFTVVVSDRGVIEASSHDKSIVVDVSGNKDSSVLVHVPAAPPVPPSLTKAKQKKAAKGPRGTYCKSRQRRV